MVGALDVFSVELATVERHAAVGTGVPQSKGFSLAIAAEDERNLKQRCLLELVAMDALGGQRAIPETSEHERIGRLALRRVEFGHGMRVPIV
jgi:hypothetical protein